MGSLAQPADAPLPDHVNADLHRAADLLILQALTDRQDDANPRPICWAVLWALTNYSKACCLAWLKLTPGGCGPFM